MSLKFNRLTRSSIRALGIGRAIMEHGIKAERLGTGDIRFSVNVQVDGQRVHRVIGRESEGVTRAQAEAYIEQARTEARAGRLGLPKGRKLYRSFSQASEDYLRLLDDSGGRNMHKKRKHFEMHINPYFGQMRIDRITDFAVLGYAKKRRDAGAAEGTINNELATLSHLFTIAVDAKWISRDVRPAIKKTTATLKPMVTLSPSQCSALLTAAKCDVDPDVFTFAAFGLNTAMRHSEILRVAYREINFDSRIIHIALAKAGAREQPITIQLADILKARRDSANDKQGFIFPPARPGRLKSKHRNSMAGAFKRVVKAAGLDPKRVTPHTMRRTAITNLILAGVPLPTIQRISGHKTLIMLLRYFHLYGAHVHEAASNLEVEISFNDSAVEAALLGTTTRELHPVAMETLTGKRAKRRVN